jgi:hypothetical protein
MKSLITIVFVLLLNPFLFSQDTTENKNDNSYSVFFESPLFYEDWWEYQNTVLTINFEYLINKKNGGLSFLLGYGRIFSSYDGVFYSDPYFNTEINYLFGKKHHFLEIGTGLGYGSSVFLKFRLGYRLNLGKRLLFRIAYTPTVYLRQHNDTEEHPPFTGFNGLSLSLGYRFGIHIPKETWNTKFKRLYGLQFDFQPLFQNYKGGKGYNLNLFLEILIHKTEKLLLTSGLGFGYGNSYRHKGSFSYNSLPLGFTMLYGNKTHFAEAGIKAAWIPIGGNKDGTYFTLQPEIGYRIHLWKRFMARVAYTPYWWLADKEGREYIEKNFVNSFTIGIGVRFH